uniref:Uncharacterized protein n=1 Tax=Pseudomonas phage RVTF4 TaxID=3236931 RepID=A0AB39CCB5_9VIRU
MDAWYLLKQLCEEHRDKPSLHWELEWVREHTERYEGHWHQLAVCRNIVTRYFKNKLVKQDVFYKPRPEKIYKFLGVSHGAGWCQGERKYVYWDPIHGQLFHREPADYRDRMSDVGTR